MAVDGDGLLTIGAFGLLTGLSVAALRHYDEVGLLVPTDIDDRTGYRRYHPDQVRRARLIRTLRAVELPIDEIKVVLDAEPDGARAVLTAHRERLAERQDELGAMGRRVQRLIEEGVMAETQGTRLVELSIGVKDLEAAKRFFEHAFGVRFQEDQHDGGPVHLHGGVGGDEDFVMLGLWERDGGPSFGFLVDDLDEAHRRALGAGATELHPPSDSDGMPRNSGVSDPDGNRIYMYQS